MERSVSSRAALASGSEVAGGAFKHIALTLHNLIRHLNHSLKYMFVPQAGIYDCVAVRTIEAANRVHH